MSKPTQADVEDVLRQKALRRLPVLRAALAKKERQLANLERYPHKREEALKKLAKQYRDHIAVIEGGSYPGYNGKPFGATPGITKGAIF